jgi:hypothetical protein
MATTTRHLADLISIGPAMLRDFDLLGIRSVPQLAKQNPKRMYARLPAEQCQWWYWSRKRKSAR